MGQYQISPKADRDLEEIAFQIALRNGEAAQKMISRIFNTFALLSEHPRIGRKRPDLRNLRSFAVSPYIIFYRVREDVEVVRVLHGARDIGSLLETEEQ